MVDSLTERLRAEALSLGVNFFGVADLSSAQEFIAEQGGEMIAQFPRAVSVGLTMPFAIVDQLPRHREKAVAMAYRSHSYDVLNRRLDDIASALAGTLQREGYRAFPVLSSQTVDEKNLRGLVSHKLAAHLAGLGWIGKSCLLVTPEVGPRVRWETVLTDAPLVSAGEPMEVRCGKCRECVDACPPQAFTGRNFAESEPREVRFDVFKCRNYQREREKEVGVSVCGMCVFVCPYGQKAARRKNP